MSMKSNKLLLTKSYVIYNNEKDKAIKVFSEKYAIEIKGKSNVLSYPGTLYVKGTSTVLACMILNQSYVINAELKLKLKIFI